MKKLYTVILFISINITIGCKTSDSLVNDSTFHVNLSTETHSKASHADITTHILLQIRNDYKDKDLSKKIFRDAARFDHPLIKYHTTPDSSIEYDFLYTIVISDIVIAESSKEIKGSEGPIAPTNGNAIAAIFAGGRVGVRQTPRGDASAYFNYKYLDLNAHISIRDFHTGMELLTDSFFDSNSAHSRTPNYLPSNEEMVDKALNNLSRMITRHLKYWNPQDLAIQYD